MGSVEIMKRLTQVLGNYVYKRKGGEFWCSSRTRQDKEGRFEVTGVGLS